MGSVASSRTISARCSRVRLTIQRWRMQAMALMSVRSKFSRVVQRRRLHQLRHRIRHHRRQPSPNPSPIPTPTPSPSPTPTPTPQPARLVVTVTSLVRSNCGSIAVGVTVQNAGGTTANNVRVTTGTLAQPVTNGTPLPQSLGNLAPGQWATRVITFSGTNHPAGKKRTLTFGGTYNGGTFTEDWKVTSP